MSLGMTAALFHMLMRGKHKKEKKINFKLMKSYNSPQKCNRILCFRYANSVEEACSALVSFTHMKILRSTYVKSLSNYVYHKKKILRNDVIEY